MTEWYEQDKARLEIRKATLHDLEHGGNDNAALGAFIADRIVRHHLATMERLRIGYDLLTWEGDILRLGFLGTGFRDPPRSAERFTSGLRVSSQAAG